MGGGQVVVKCEATSNLTTGTTEEGGRGLEDPEQVSGRDHGAGVGREGQDLHQWTRISSDAYLGQGVTSYPSPIAAGVWLVMSQHIPGYLSHDPFLERFLAE